MNVLYFVGLVYIGLTLSLIITDGIKGDLAPPWWHYALWPVAIYIGWRDERDRRRDPDAHPASRLDG